ncbi:MAG: hypothetical protein L0229_28150 [Blastocatellia bacterium]|nr:hypothetical protein [Blastocatellia bacterium]
MPFILRKIRKAKWYKSEGVPWLAEGDLQADALVDLATKGNRLSIYLVYDDRSNLERVVAALATANTDYISDFEYALFDLSALEKIGIELEKIEGETPDAMVNSWHCDLVELSASKILALATIIRSQAKRKRILSRRVLELVESAIASQQIDPTKLKPKLFEKIN